MTTFDTYLPMILDRGTVEARHDGSSTVEAYHLLLAISADRDSAGGRVLASVGLDHDALRAALDREHAQSLAAAGVTVATFDLPRPATRGRSPQPGTSVRLALERGVGPVGRKRALRPIHLLLGILEAEVGTVPRALALAGVDRIDLADRVRRTLATQR